MGQSPINVVTSYKVLTTNKGHGNTKVKHHLTSVCTGVKRGEEHRYGKRRTEMLIRGKP